MAQMLSRDRVILCGAGISAPPPAQLPTVALFLDELEAACKAQLSLSHAQIHLGLRGNGVSAPPRFEQVIAVLLEFDPELHCLSYLRIDPGTAEHRSNGLHKYIAQHVREGGTAITTNFDALIELAHLSLYRVDIADSPGSLHKIHGSIQTTVNGQLLATDRRAMKADIASVAAGTPISGVGGTLRELTAQVRDRDLLVIGYSFSDSFDVTPALMHATPASATIIEYAPEPLREVAELDALPNFAEIEVAWRSRGTHLHFLRGDPGELVPEWMRARSTPALPREQSTLIPAYTIDQLHYLIARLLQVQNQSRASNQLFQTLRSCTKDPEIRTRATYRFAHTLSDWDEIILLEDDLMDPEASTEIRLQTLILLLDARAFIGPGKAFLKVFSEFKSLVREVPGERERLLYLGKAHTCFANYLMSRGRPRWALSFAEASLLERTRYGGPADIFYAEYACCLSLVLSADLSRLSTRLASLRRYGEAIGDQVSQICALTIEGLDLLARDATEEALACLEKARGFQTVDSDDTQVDPELDLYILEARVRIFGWNDVAMTELRRIAAYVADHRYVYFGPVVDALEQASRGVRVAGRLDRLSRAHLRRAGIDPLG